MILKLVCKRKGLSGCLYVCCKDFFFRRLFSVQVPSCKHKVGVWTKSEVFLVSIVCYSVIPLLESNGRIFFSMIKNTNVFALDISVSFMGTLPPFIILSLLERSLQSMLHNMSLQRLKGLALLSPLLV